MSVIQCRRENVLVVDFTHTKAIQPAFHNGSNKVKLINNAVNVAYTRIWGDIFVPTPYAPLHTCTHTYPRKQSNCARVL